MMQRSLEIQGEKKVQVAKPGVVAMKKEQAEPAIVK